MYLDVHGLTIPLCHRDQRLLPATGQPVSHRRMQAFKIRLLDGEKHLRRSEDADMHDVRLLPCLLVDSRLP